MPNVTYCVPVDNFPSSDRNAILDDIRTTFSSPDAPVIPTPVCHRLFDPSDSRPTDLLSNLSTHPLVIADCSDCRTPNAEKPSPLPHRPFSFVSETSRAMQEDAPVGTAVAIIGHSMRVSKKNAVLFDESDDRWAVRGDPSTVLLAAISGRPAVLCTSVTSAEGEIDSTVASDILAGLAVASFPPARDVYSLPWVAFYSLGRAVSALNSLRRCWPSNVALVHVGSDQQSKVFSFGPDIEKKADEALLDPLSLISTVFEAAQQNDLPHETEWSKQSCLDVLVNICETESGRLLWEAAIVVEHVLSISNGDPDTASRLFSANRVLDLFLASSIDVHSLWPCSTNNTAIQVLLAAQKGVDVTTPFGKISMKTIAPAGAHPYDHLAPSAMNATKLWTYQRTTDGIRLWYGRSISSKAALDRISAQKGADNIEFTIHDGLVYCKQISASDGARAVGKAFRAAQLNVLGVEGRMEFEHVPRERQEIHIYEMDWRAASRTLVNEMISGGINDKVSAWLLLRLRSGDVTVRQMDTLPSYLKRSDAKIKKDEGVVVSSALYPKTVSKLPMYFASGYAWLDIANNRELYRVERQGRLIHMTDEMFGAPHHNVNDLRECSPIGNYGLV